MAITGYRELSQLEIELINRVKDEAINIGEMCDEFVTREEIDPRWLAIARTQLQQGFMALARAIAKPTTF